MGVPDGPSEKRRSTLLMTQPTKVVPLAKALHAAGVTVQLHHCVPKSMTPSPDGPVQEADSVEVVTPSQLYGSRTELQRPECGQARSARSARSAPSQPDTGTRSRRGRRCHGTLTRFGWTRRRTPSCDECVFPPRVGEPRRTADLADSAPDGHGAFDLVDASDRRQSDIATRQAQAAGAGWKT